VRCLKLHSKRLFCLCFFFFLLKENVFFKKKKKKKKKNSARGQFWRMIWEYDVPTIVMLNEDTEGVHRHSDIQRYCPNVLNEWEAYGEIEVQRVLCLFGRF
jgi:hypothetical protein